MADGFKNLTNNLVNISEIYKNSNALVYKKEINKSKRCQDNIGKRELLDEI